MILSTVSYSQIANTPVDLILCDDDYDGLTQFDLESQTAEVLGAQDPSQFNVSYHDSFADAEANTNTLSSPYTNSTPGVQTIYVRVTDSVTNDYTTTSFDLIVNPLPIANFVNDLEVCDDNTDGSAQNGFSQTFDLELQTAGILGMQDPTQFSVTYHNSPADALSGNAPIATPAMYENSTPNLETIYVRVTNNTSGCFTAQTSFDIIVNELPIANIVSDIEVCDDVTDGDDTNGFVQNFDLESQTAQVLDGQNPSQFIVSYHNSLVDAEDNTNNLTSPYANSLPNLEAIFVRITNTETGCFTTNNFSLIVNNCSNTPITNSDFQTAINTCLSTNPEDGLCTNSEYGAMPDWDVSSVTDMALAFSDRTDFNGDISSWDTGNVTSMYQMFLNASSFNQPIGDWDVSSVSSFKQMFSTATSFNQNISSWVTSSANNMSYMFSNAFAFNQPLNNWDVSNVTDMKYMFNNATSFNQPLNDWDLINMQYMEGMFRYATAFNEPLNDWNVGNVTIMNYLFQNASSFNQPIGDWDVSNVTLMNNMFSNATSFNQNISSWCVSNITSEPTDFSNGSPLSESNKPVWGYLSNC